MGFEHFVTVEGAQAERAQRAFIGFEEWALQRFKGQGWLEMYAAAVVPDAVFHSPDEMYAAGFVQASYADPEGQLSARLDALYAGDPEPPEHIHFVPDSHWPADGQALLWWQEIPWLRKLPSEVMEKLYSLIEAHDALQVWAEIIGEGTRQADLVEGMIGQIFAGTGADAVRFTRNGDAVSIGSRPA